MVATASETLSKHDEDEDDDEDEDEDDDNDDDDDDNGSKRPKRPAAEVSPAVASLEVCSSVDGIMIFIVILYVAQYLLVYDLAFAATRVVTDILLRIVRVLDAVDIVFIYSYLDFRI